MGAEKRLRNANAITDAKTNFFITVLLGIAKIEIKTQTLAHGMQNRLLGLFYAGGMGLPCHLGFQCDLGWIIESPAPCDKQSCAEKQ
jgi:hypothetical protein